MKQKPIELNRIEIFANRPAPSMDAMLVLKQYRCMGLAVCRDCTVSEVRVPGYRCFLASSLIVACLLYIYTCNSYLHSRYVGVFAPVEADV